MPLFIFISGYFSERLELKKIIKRLIIPFYIWNIAYSFISYFMQRSKLITYGCEELNFKDIFYYPWFAGSLHGLSIASWFALSLALVELTILLIRRLTNNRHLGIITILTTIISCLSIKYYLEVTNPSIYLRTVVRILFMMEFFMMGYVYKLKLEEYDKFSNLWTFVGIFIVQYIVSMINNRSPITFGIAEPIFENFKDSYCFLPTIVSIIGIMFYLRISKILSVLGENRIIRQIGEHTSSVMFHHQFVFLCLNLLFIKLGDYIDFFKVNIEQFKQNCWYAIDPLGDGRFCLLYTVMGIAVPILAVNIFNSIMKNVFNGIRIKWKVKS